MKPIKGMNLDVSPDSQPQGTYRMARNWVYDAEFDGLTQAPGHKDLAKVIGAPPFTDTGNTGVHTVGYHVFENGDMVLLQLARANSLNYDAIRLYRAATNDYISIVESDELNLNYEHDYHLVSFLNTDDERIVIITDQVNKPLVFNIDAATQPDYDLSYLFPTRRYPRITMQSHNTGGLERGTYFFCVQYELEDGTTTDFGPVAGPFRILENQTGVGLSLTRVDTNYTKLRIGMIGLTGGAIVTRVVAERAADAASVNVFVEGSAIDEVLLEELAVLPVSYSSAETLEFYDNRLYLGNVTSETENTATFQGYANAIEPIWMVRKSSLSIATDNVDDDPTTHGFMPDEVYAFYVAWVRDDGTYTQAYHIPGRTSGTSTVNVPAAFAGGSATTVNITETSSLSGIISSTGSGQVNEDNLVGYLRNDRNIFDPGETGYNQIKYFHTRCTAKPFSDQTYYHHGQMGYWQNDEEQYPTGFPNGVNYNYDQGGTEATGTSAVTLAGTPVKHHRFPSIGWCIENIDTYAFSARRDHTFDVRFDFVQMPPGMKGAVFYHAKRTNSNNLVLTHTPIHFGALNTWSLSGAGGSAYRGYSTQAAINARNGNHPLFATGGQGLAGYQFSVGGTLYDEILEAAGDPHKSTGAEFAAADFHENLDNQTSTWSNEANDRFGTHYGKAVSHAQDILAVRPQLPQHMYTRFEYMLIQEEKYPNSIDGNVAGFGNTRGQIMSIADNTSDAFFASSDPSVGSNQPGINDSRKAVFDMTQASTDVNQPFEWSAILPCRNQRYMPAGVVDDDVKFDNRKAPECLYWDYKNISNTDTPYSNQPYYHDAGDRLWYSVLNNPNTFPDTGTGDTDNASWTTTYGSNTDSQRNFHGWFPQIFHTRARIGAVQRLPFVNVNAMRFTCYPNYTQQDLVSCTGFVPAEDFENAPDVNGEASTLKSLNRSRVHGDVLHSKTQYRVTAALGYTAGFNTTDENTSAGAGNAGSNSNVNSYIFQDLPDDGTRNDTRGIVVTLNKVPTISPIEALMHNKDKDQHKDEDYANLLRPASVANTNDNSFDADLMRLNDWVQPLISDGVDQPNSSFRYRIARSRAQDNNADTLNFRRFAALDFFEQPRDRGVIKNLQGYADKLLIHHEDALFLTVGKESIQTTTGAVVLGSGDIFRVKPQELTPTEFGFAGTQDALAAVLTPQGYFWVDRKRRKVFLYNGKVNEISNRGMRAWFEDHLDLETQFYPGSVTSFCPGVQAAYDPVFNRVMLLIRDVDITGTLGTDPTFRPSSLNAYYGDTNYDVKDQVISYSFNNNAWVSFHDMPYNVFVSSATKLYGFQTTSGTNPGALIRELNDFTAAGDVSYILDYKTQSKVPAQIDIAFPANEPVQWQSYSWHTKARQHRPGNSNYGHIDLTKTFEKAAVYNDYQCSGDVSFVKASDVDVTSVQRTTLRHNGTRYQFNGFRDLVQDRTARFLDPDYNFVTANINASKNWYEQRRFKSTHTVLRLLTGLDTTNLLYLYDVDAKVRKAYR